MSEANAARPAHFDRRKRVGFTYLPGTVAAATDEWPTDEFGNISTTPANSFFSDASGTVLGGTRFFIRGACRIRIAGGTVTLEVNAHVPATPIVTFPFSGAVVGREIDTVEFSQARPEFTAGFSVQRPAGIAPHDDLYLFWTAFGVRK